MPNQYDGSPVKCQGFVIQCNLYIGNHPADFTSDKDRVDFVTSLLTGKPLMGHSPVGLSRF